MGAAAGTPRAERSSGDVGASSRWAWSVDRRRPRSRRLRPQRPHPPPAARTHPPRAGSSRSPGLPASRDRPRAGGAWGAPAATSSRLQRGRASCASRGWGAQQAQAWAQPGAGLLGPGRREGRGGGLVGRAGIRSRFRHWLGQRGRGLGGPGAGGGAGEPGMCWWEGSGGGGSATEPVGDHPAGPRPASRL